MGWGKGNIDPDFKTSVTGVYVPLPRGRTAFSAVLSLGFPASLRILSAYEIILLKKITRGRRTQNEITEMLVSAAPENPRCPGGVGINFTGMGLYRSCVCVRPCVGAGQHGAGTAGCSRADYLLTEKRDHPAGDGVSGKPLWVAYGSFLAAGEGSALEIFDSGSGVWMKFHALLLN